MDFPYVNPYISRRNFFDGSASSDSRTTAPQKSKQSTKRKRLRDSSESLKLNEDVVSVIRQFLNFTELMCLRYTCRHFYYVVNSFLRRSFFWKVIPECLFKELTACRHRSKSVRCFIIGLNRININQTERIELDEEVRSYHLWNRSFEFVVRLYHHAPNLKELIIHMNSLPLLDFSADDLRVKVAYVKGLKFLINPDSTHLYSVRTKTVFRERIKKLHELKVSTNIRLCKNKKHSAPHTTNTCFILDDVSCFSCKKDKKHCMFTFPYYQKCVCCEKRSCVDCFVSKGWLEHCQKCKVFYCKSTCHGSICPTCERVACPQCKIHRCLLCKKKCCDHCSSKYVDGDRSLIVCSPCFTGEAKKKNAGICVEAENSDGNNVLTRDGSYVGRRLNSVNIELPHPAIRSMRVLEVDDDEDDFLNFLPDNNFQDNNYQSFPDDVFEWNIQ